MPRRSRWKAWEENDPGVRRPSLSPRQPVFGRKTGAAFPLLNPPEQKQRGRRWRYVRGQTHARPGAHGLRSLRRKAARDIDYSVYPYPTVTLPGYVLLNAVISTPISSSFDLFVRLDNILNTRYETVWGYGTLGFAATVGFRLNR